VDALLDAVRGETMTHLVVSHTHRDHSPAARALQAATGAPIVGCGPHRSARVLAAGELNPLEASADGEHRPDREMAEGDAIEGPGWRLQAVETPGHTANHLCFALPEEAALFSADHVMAWATSIVAPPDGAMGPYMASLEKLRSRSEESTGRATAARFAIRSASCARSFITGGRGRSRSCRASRPATARSRTSSGRSTRDCRRRSSARRACRCWRTWRTWSAAGIVATDGPSSLDGEYRPGAEQP
jgi:hypothetical protein